LIEKFLRYEFKYLLDQSATTAIKRDIGHFMHKDPRATLDGDETYDVLSLYFDTQRHSNYYQKIDGVKSRTKYRLRTYGVLGLLDAPIFFEEKSRNNNRVAKIREQVTTQFSHTLTRGMPIPLDQTYGDVVDRFMIENAHHRLSPKVLVGYTRHPLTSNHDGFFRVTFDSNLYAHHSKSISTLEYITPRWVSLVPNMSIMEVKFNRSIPAWFHRIIQCYELERISISKFVLGISRLNLAADLS
jgi:hypothetical protein